LVDLQGEVEGLKRVESVEKDKGVVAFRANHPY